MKKNNSISFRSVLLSAAVLGLVSSVATSGLETTAAITAGVDHSDNITRSDDIIPGDDTTDSGGVDGPRSDIQSQVRLDVGLTDSTAKFDTELSYAFTARDFKNDLQSDNEVVDGDARILWTPLPDRLAWELTNNVSDTVRNALLADTPDNRQQRNIFSTGPNITVRVSPVDQLSAELRYVDVNVESSNDNTGATADALQQGSDSERKLGRLRWTHGLSAVSDFLARAEYEDVEASFDLTYTRLLVGYGARLRNGSYEIYVGANKVEPDVGEEFDGSVVQVAFTHDFGGHSLDITLVKEATDTSVGFGTSSLRSDTFNPRDSNFDSFSIVERQRADITYQNFLICGACSVRVNAFYDDQDYQDRDADQGFLAQARDQKRYGFTVGLIYALRSNVDLVANADYNVTDFVDDPDGLEYESSAYTLGLNYDVVRNVSIGLRVRQLTRDATVEGLDFDELRGGITLRYTF